MPFNVSISLHFCIDFSFNCVYILVPVLIRIQDKPKESFRQPVMMKSFRQHPLMLMTHQKKKN